MYITNFYGKFSDNLDATEIPEHTNVQRVAHLLGVPVQSLIDALTRRTIFAHGETVVSILLRRNAVTLHTELLLNHVRVNRSQRCRETNRSILETRSSKGYTGDYLYTS